MQQRSSEAQGFKFFYFFKNFLGILCLEPKWLSSIGRCTKSGNNP
jgi:hypothetical protein